MTGVWMLIAALAGYWFNELRHRREMGVKIIEIAVGILAEEPDKNKGLRRWAIGALEHYAEKANVPLNKEARDDLEGEALPVFTYFVEPACTIRVGSSPQASSAISDTSSATPVKQ